MKEPWFKHKWVMTLLHITFWSLLFLLPYLLQPSSQERQGPNVRSSRPDLELFNLVKGFFWVGLFYFNAYFLVPRLLNQRKYFLYILLLCIIIALLSVLEMLYFNLEGHHRPFRLRGFIFFNLFPFLFIITASTAYRMFSERVTEEKKAREKEAEALKSELSFLRSQISPHFMFNVLNNIVALARKGSDQVEPSLIRLSTIMRYFLYENAKDTIALEKEIEYLRNYIELQEQRFGSTTMVGLSIGDPDQSYQIEPMLLIPFVENAFKHGIVQNGSIHITLVAQNGLLDFSVTNPYGNKADEVKDETSGIGLANVTRRLKLSYPERHSLQIDTKKDTYTIHLQLKLR